MQTPTGGSARARVLVAAWLTCAASAQAPTFAGEGVATWAARLEADVEPWVDALAAGGADSLDVLRPLLSHDNYYVCVRSHLAVQRIGPAAAPLAPLLLGWLRDDDLTWSRHNVAASALAAIGADAPEVLDALAARCASTTVPALRGSCARALARLDDDAGRRLLGLAARGAFAEPAHAVAALVAVGEPAVDPMIAALDQRGARADCARRVLPELGFVVCTRLERAGHPELAQLALQRGALRTVSLHDEYELVVDGPQPALARLPSGTFETGSGHGHALTLWRTHEGARGLVVERLRLRTEFADGGRDKSFVVTADRAVLPRALGLDLARQLAALGRMSLRRRADAPVGGGSSTANFDARARLVLDDEVLLDARFAGYPSTTNAAARFRAEAATRALQQAVRGAAFEPREPDDRDRDQVRARLDESGHLWWVRERLQGMADALRELR